MCNSIALLGFQIVRKVHKYSQSISFDIELIAIIIIAVLFLIIELKIMSLKEFI